MKLSKLIYLLPFLLFMAIAGPAFSSSVVTNPSDSLNISLKSEQMLIRLNEIKEMDKSSLTGTEKKNLRREVRDMKKEMKAVSGGVYLSVGAIIIIILLLILLL